jgi:hypothetical protein
MSMNTEAATDDISGLGVLRIVKDFITGWHSKNMGNRK